MADSRHGVDMDTTLFDGKRFTEAFECESTLKTALGASYTAEQTVFAVWAPLAAEVKLNIYLGGTSAHAVTRVMRKRIPDTGRWGGVWELAVKGDLNGKYYTYSVNNFGIIAETIDPYAKACNANGSRGMVIDLKSTDPAGWERDGHLYALDPKAADIPVVWEAHVKDFSASADSGMKYKGKYLAFTETGTAVPGMPELKTGVDYLKELGITYVQLNPVYDFATVDECDLSVADATKDAFNWGYDPQNYNIPEGSYSTDPAHGEVRINEFKRMVMALHAAGIGVIMDVVFNHTYTVSGQAFHDTVPYYYHRTDENGRFTDLSGCGNDTASERAMMRKYIVDSVVYWAEEYHIDGFRFDLMGVHDLETIKAVRAALDALDGGNGKKLLMYGEPWTGEYGSDVVPHSFTSRISAGEPDNRLIKHCGADALPPRVGVFNDSGRNALRGDNSPGWGWIQGNGDSGNGVAAMLCGYARGSALCSRNVAYAAAHDNFTLWDQTVGKKPGRESPLVYEDAVWYTVKRNKLAAAAYLMSPGISFMLAGEEMGRTKYGNENSYSSPVKLNQIVWSRQAETQELVRHFKKLISLRRAHPEVFSYTAAARPDYRHGEFFASGTAVRGGRAGFGIALDASPDRLCGKIVIDSDEYEF